MGRPKFLDTVTVRKFINRNISIVYGTMLGDAYIMERGTGSGLRILHAEDQKDLVMHKYELFKEVAPTPPRSFPHEKWGQPKWYFWTACDVEWQKVWSTFHQNCRTKVFNGQKIRYKVVTPQILREIDNRGLAMWIMDDGSYSYGCQKDYPEKPMYVFRLHTEGYTLEENELIVEWFKERHSVRATVGEHRRNLKDGTPVTYFYVRIGWKEFEKIQKRVEPFIIPSLRHKIGLRSPQDKGRLDLIKAKTRSEPLGN